MHKTPFSNLGPALLISTMTILVGCASTPYHKEVRNQANERYDLVQAQMAYDQAMQAYSTGQFDKALRLIDGALARFPERPDYLVLKGRIHLETHRLELAMDLFEKAWTHDEKRADAHYFAGIIYQRWSDHERAAGSYRAAFEIDSTNPQYLLASAEALIACGRYHDAQQLIEPRLAQFEHNAALRQLLGQIALLQGRPVDAARLFSQARLINPDDPMILEELVRAHFAAGDYANCHHTLRQLAARQKEPRLDLLHIEARCLTMLDRPSEARNIYLKLVEMAPTDDTLWVELGNVAYEVGDDRRVALSSSRILSLNPARFEGYLLRGLFEQRQGRQDEAIRWFQKATELAPSDAAWPHLILGMALEERGERNEALRCYAAAVKAEPENSQARQLLAGLESAVLATETGIHQP